MKLLLALILSVTLVAFAAEALAGERAYWAGGIDEVLYGTWVRKSDSPPQKIIWKPDGTFESFKSPSSERPSWLGRYLITGKWIDSEGNIWYKWHWVGNWGREGYTLGKTSNSGNTLEFMHASDTHPMEIDPKSREYRKFTRE